jgi:hypothetical protein
MKQDKVNLNTMLIARGFKRDLISVGMDTWKRGTQSVIRDNTNKIVCFYLRDPKYTTSDTVYLMPDDNKKIIAFVTKELPLCRKSKD